MTFIGSEVTYSTNPRARSVMVELFEVWDRSAGARSIRYSREAAFLGDGKTVDIPVPAIRDFMRSRVGIVQLTRVLVLLSFAEASRLQLVACVPHVRVDEVFTGVERDAQAARVGARNGHQWSHMWCDEGYEADLHFVAKHLGLIRAWFQDKPGFPHYDLTPGRRHAAIDLGVQKTSLRTWLAARREREAADTTS